MGLGLPNFNFIFQSKGISAIERSGQRNCGGYFER